jgi:hypothetical protein
MKYVGKEFLYIKKEELWTLTHIRRQYVCIVKQTWSGPEGSRELKFPNYMTTAQDGGKVVSPKHRPPLHPGSAPGTHFC